MKLTRFWLEFDADPECLPLGTWMGCGVTALDESQALAMVQERVFGGRSLPPIKKLIANIDISTLDAGHVRPNMGIPVVLGIWFPIGY